MTGAGPGGAGGVQRAVAHEPGEGGAVQRGGHGQQAQFGAQGALEVQAQGEGEVGVEVALMRLVEQHRRHAVEDGVRLQAAHQQALGDHLDARALGHQPIQPGGEADRAARRALAQHIGHAPRGGAGGDAAGFQHQDAAARGPGLVLQDQRHAALSCRRRAGRRARRSRRCAARR